MKRWPLILAFLVTFAAGSMVGGFMTAKYAWKKMMFPPKTEELTEQILGHLKKDLELTPEQIEKIRPIVKHHAEQGVAFHREIFERIHQGMQELDADIVPELTPAQRDKQAKLQADRGQHFHNH